jgi:hypothetical protein
LVRERIEDFLLCLRILGGAERAADVLPRGARRAGAADCLAECFVDGGRGSTALAQGFQWYWLTAVVESESEPLAMPGQA